MENRTARGIMGPKEVRKCRADLSTLLAADGLELATIVSVLATTASDALGLAIGTSSRAPALALSNTAVDFWLSIDAGNQNDATWDNGGQRCEVVITCTLNDSPASTVQVIYGIVIAAGEAP